MATKVLWYPETPDDPFKMAETIHAGEQAALEQGIGFNVLVCQSIRQHLGLPKVDLGKARLARDAAQEAKRGKLKVARKAAKDKTEKKTGKKSAKKK